MIERVRLPWKHQDRIPSQNLVSRGRLGKSFGQAGRDS